MVKRLLLIGLLCIGLIFLVSAEATAICRTLGGILKCCTFGAPNCPCPPFCRTSGINVMGSLDSGGSLCADTFLKGVGNPEQNDVAVCVALYFDEAEGRCLNQPGNSNQAEGTAFSPDLTVTDQTLIEPYMLTDERGSATVGNICWDWETEIYGPILEWINAHLSEVCPNDNWHFQEESLKINVIYAYHSAYQENRSGDMYSTSALCRKCDLVSDGAECGYNCNTVSISECQSRGMAGICLGAVNPQ